MWEALRPVATSAARNLGLLSLQGNAKKIQVQNGEKAATVMQCRDGFDESKVVLLDSMGLG